MTSNCRLVGSSLPKSNLLLNGTQMEARVLARATNPSEFVARDIPDDAEKSAQLSVCSWSTLTALVLTPGKESSESIVKKVRDGTLDARG
jgi:hypothetical protein